MLINVLLYDKMNRKAICRVFLSGCPLGYPERLAEWLRERHYDVTQFTWCYMTEDGTVDIQDTIAERDGYLLDKVVRDEVEKWQETINN